MQLKKMFTLMASILTICASNLCVFAMNRCNSEKNLMDMQINRYSQISVKVSNNKTNKEGEFLVNLEVEEKLIDNKIKKKYFIVYKDNRSYKRINCSICQQPLVLVSSDKITIGNCKDIFIEDKNQAQKIFSTIIKHSMHKTCAKKWFNECINKNISQSCPYCRAKLEFVYYVTPFKKKKS